MTTAAVDAATQEELRSEEQWKACLLEVEPGSEEAERLLSDLVAASHNFAKVKSRTATTFLAVFAKFLWKACQSMSRTSLWYHSGLTLMFLLQHTSLVPVIKAVLQFCVG